MVFSSLLFLFRFLPVFLAIYYLAPRRYSNAVLFLGSLVFYGWGEPVYMSLLLFSTAVDYVHGRLAGKYREEGRTAAAKGVVASSVIINLGLLGIFKYSDFLIGSLNQAGGLALPLPGLGLPIGISFYTFQTMSYTIDVYRGDAKPQRDIIAFGAYVSMFPQLIAGPIVRYHTIAGQLGGRNVDLEKAADGVKYFVIGLGKKVLLANNAGAIWTEVSHAAAGDRTVLMAWMGIFAYGMQIYFDFSGYSDMAVGLGKMLGFSFPENFHYPYMAKSITDFWRRWHISLGTWFKEYVYIPLGGNRKGMARQVRNILIVWLLTGIWHGAAWNYLLWGLYFGLLLLMEKFVLKRWLLRLPGAAQSVYAMVLVYFGWVLFAHENLSEGMAYLAQMAGLGNVPFVSQRTVYMLLTGLPLLLTAAVGSTHVPAILCGKIFAAIPEKAKAAAECGFIAVVLLLSTAYLVDASYNPFLYFRF